MSVQLEGYSEQDIAQQGTGEPPSPEDTDYRNPFQHDADRILYSPEFRALAGKTQVVAANDSGIFHNRLTHSLKVAQLGRRMTQMLTGKAQKVVGISARVVGPSPDLVESACLLHDIGHPPFGHIGEETLCSAMDESDNGREDDGFQANAQNFRIALSLSCRGGLITDGVRGLNLTNAVLDSALKYPWERDNRAPGSEGLYGRSHWCVYAATEKDALLTILQSRGCIDDKHNRLVPPEAGERGTIARPVEEQIMDWADEISYVCHDLEDFTKAGLIPLDDILSGATIQMDDRYPKSPLPNMAEIDRFSTYLAGASFSGSTLGSTGQAWLKDVFNILSGLFLSRSKQKEDCAQSRSQSMFSTTLLLNYFLQATSLEAVNDSCTLTGYNARLKIAPEVRDVAYTLNQMVHCYVIDRPSLATQQAGQRRIVQDLYEVFSQTDRDSLFSDYWREVKESLLASGLSEERTRRRLAADMVSSMTESEAVRVHHRITGIEYGQLLDTL